MPIAGALSAIAALLLSVVGVFQDAPPIEQESQEVVSVEASLDRPPAPVAIVTLNDNTRWGGAQLVVGHVLHEGESVNLQEGKARVSVGFGAEIVAEGPCEFTFLDHARVRLVKGDLAVDVAEWAKGFTVVTDTMEIVDLGTTFTVSATPGAKVEANVLKGLVRIHPSKTNADERNSLLLSEGQGISIGEQGRRTIRKAPEGKSPRGLGFGKLAHYHPINLHNTGIGLGVGHEDPHWLVVDGPRGGNYYPVYAAVCVPDKRYLANEPDVSQWISTIGWREAASDSVYTFQTTFDLSGYDLSTIQLFGRFLADNGIKEVRVNGRPVSIESWSDNRRGQWFRETQYRFINVTDNLVQKENVVEIDVWNGAINSVSRPNPMALRVEWYAFGRNSAVAESNLGVYRQGAEYERHVESLITAAVAAH